MNDITCLWFHVQEETLCPHGRGTQMDQAGWQDLGAEEPYRAACSWRGRRDLEQGQGVRGPPWRKEERGAAKTGCDELMAAPIPCAPVREQGQNSGRWVQDLNSLKWLAVNSISPSGVCLAHGSHWWMISACPQLNLKTQWLQLCFLSPAQMRRTVIEQL